MGKAKGLSAGIITSLSFGLIPLFSLPLMREGLGFNSILFYRFLLAAGALAVMMGLHREGFRIAWRDVPIILLLGAFYTASALFLFWGYQFMGAGLATTFHFTYPIFVTLFLLSFFGERASWGTWLAILLAVCGVALLSLRGDEQSLNPVGLVIVLLSAVGYASYITAVNKSRVYGMNGRKLAFYVFIVTTICFAVSAQLDGGIQPVRNAMSWANLLLLAIVPTVISNVTLVVAVQNIGGTLTSILGALEPLTAVAIGALFFGESFTRQDGLGIALILVAVSVVILNSTLQRAANRIFRWSRPRHA